MDYLAGNVQLVIAIFELKLGTKQLYLYQIYILKIYKIY